MGGRSGRGGHPQEQQRSHAGAEGKLLQQGRRQQIPHRHWPAAPRPAPPRKPWTTLRCIQFTGHRLYNIIYKWRCT